MEFYRFDDGPFYIDPILIERIFQLVKETPKGYWIREQGGFSHLTKKRWISKTSHKRFAYPTKEEAYRSFVTRKQRQIKILFWQLRRVEESLRLAYKRLHTKGDPNCPDQNS